MGGIDRGAGAFCAGSGAGVVVGASWARAMARNPVSAKAKVTELENSLRMGSLYRPRLGQAS
ncbi:MAG: hypothetical protein ABI551_04965 [Polyangiaceae bacterium]